jgi:predicted sugar kinase
MCHLNHQKISHAIYSKTPKTITIRSKSRSYSKREEEITKREGLKLVRKYGWTSLEKKIRRKLGFVNSYIEYIPDEFLGFVKQLKEVEPLCKEFYKVMNRVWQDACTTGVKYMEESQLQDTVSSFMFHCFVYLINNLGR